jgi:hypothetical protein
MTRYQRRMARQEEAREDARCAFLADADNRIARFKGHTPHTIDGQPTFAARVGGFGNRSRQGRSERTRDGGLRFVPAKDREVSRGMVKP